MCINALQNAVALWNDPNELNILLRRWNYAQNQYHEELVVDWVWKVKSVVDLGCGSGRYADVLQCDGYYGYDSSTAMLNAATKKMRLFTRCDVEFASADIFEFSSDRHYDVALLIDVAQHQECPIRAIERIIQLWDADRYIVSLLVGNELMELYNAIVVPFSDLFDITGEILVTRLFVDHCSQEKFAWVLMEITR